MRQTNESGSQTSPTSQPPGHGPCPGGGSYGRHPGLRLGPRTSWRPDPRADRPLRRSGIRAFFHPRGRDTAGDLKGWLAETGHRVTEAILYQAEETGPPPAPIAAALARAEIGLITIWSPRGAAILASHLAGGIADLGRTSLLAISPNSAAPLAESGFQHMMVAEAPNSAAMIAAIRSYSTGARQ